MLRENEFRPISFNRRENVEDSRKVLEKEGFTSLEVNNLIRFRKTVEEKEAPQLRRLEFYRWMYETGRLTDVPKSDQIVSESQEPLTLENLIKVPVVKKQETHTQRRGKRN